MNFVRKMGPVYLLALGVLVVAPPASLLHAATAGNSFYEVSVIDLPGGAGIGVYTSTTGILHPVTSALGQQNVLFGGGIPSSSWTTIHSYTSNTTYTQRAGQTLQAGAPAPLLLEGFVVPGEEALPSGTEGFVTHYRVTSTGGGGNEDLDIFQTVRAVGAVFNDAAVEITTEVSNLGASDAQIGIRYLLDFQIGGGDDGPAFQFRNPDGLIEVLELDQTSPAADTFEMHDNNDPNDFLCSLSPVNTPFPLFGVGGSVRGPVSLQPTAPTTLQFVSWPHVSGLPGKISSFAAQDAFSYAIGSQDAATCTTSVDDSGANYFWGETQGTAFTIPAGHSARSTAYLFAFLPGQQPLFPIGVEDCNDGVDNDGDGLIDDDDPDCAPLVVDLASFETQEIRRGIKVTWSTASEIDNAGFLLLRGRSPTGPFVPVTPFLIPAKGSAISGASYEFEDRDVRRRTVYYYRLVDVEVSGLSTPHGPVAGSWGAPKAPRGRRRH
jgi:hypothetical protein